MEVSVKRYVWPVQVWEMVESAVGAWVRVEDHEAECAALRAEVERLRQNLSFAGDALRLSEDDGERAESRLAAATERMQAVAQALSDTHACDKTRIHNALEILGAAQPATK